MFLRCTLVPNRFFSDSNLPSIVLIYQVQIADVHRSCPEKNELGFQVATGREELGETQSHLLPKMEDSVFRRKPTFFRSIPFQILVVGSRAFCAPGI